MGKMNNKSELSDMEVMDQMREALLQEEQGDDEEQTTQKFSFGDEEPTLVRAFEAIIDMKALESLVDRGYLICNRSFHRPTFRMPFYVLEAFNNNQDVNSID